MEDCVDLYESFFTKEEADSFYNDLLKLNLTFSLVTIEDSKIIEIPRKIGYFSDIGEDYVYANLMLKGQTWSPVLLAIKEALEKKMNYSFNSVLVNLYRDGNDTIDWHTYYKNFIELIYGK
jgi:alkylated DNA repair dioxygenase AlkB